VSVDIGNGPVYNLIDQQRHLFLDALNGKCSREGKQCNNAAPLNTVTEQFVYDRYERRLGVVGSDMQLVAHVVKHLPDKAQENVTKSTASSVWHNTTAK